MIARLPGQVKFQGEAGWVPAQSSAAAVPFQLLRRALDAAVTAEDAAVADLRPQALAAAGAIPEKETGVRRHRGDGRHSAARTGEHALQRGRRAHLARDRSFDKTSQGLTEAFYDWALSGTVTLGQIRGIVVPDPNLTLSVLPY